MYRSEVWVVAAVVASRDGDVLALKDARVALHPLLVAGLYEHHLLVVVHLVARHVASQHALIALASLHAAVATQVSRHVHTQFTVLLPALLFRAISNYNCLFHKINSFYSF